MYTCNKLNVVTAQAPVAPAAPPTPPVAPAPPPAPTAPPVPPAPPMGGGPPAPPGGGGPPAPPPPPPGPPIGGGGGSLADQIAAAKLKKAKVGVHYQTEALLLWPSDSEVSVSRLKFDISGKDRAITG